MALERMENTDYGPYVRLDPAADTLQVKFQTGPRKEHGTNGEQVDVLIEIARDVVTSLNRSVPCDENTHAIRCMQEALWWLNERTRKRTESGIEGRNL